RGQVFDACASVEAAPPPNPPPQAGEGNSLLRPQPRVPSGGAFDGAGEVFGGLRAGDDDAAAEYEAGDAVDAGFLGAVGFAFDAIDVGVAGEEFSYQIAVHAAVDPGLDQDLGVAQIAALG